MDLIKKHYEKVLLGLVLLGLTAAVAALPIVISSKRDKLRTTREGLTNPRVKPLPPLDMAMEDAAIQRVKSPLQLDFTTKHNLVNPVLWQKRADGALIKIQTGNEVGPGAIEIMAIKPLYLKLTYNSLSASGSGYQIAIDREGSGKHTSTIVSKENNKSDLLNLQQVAGPPEKPTELVLEWKETGETIHLAPDKPFRQVEDYAADLKYPPEPNKVWANRRTNSPPLFFNNAQYKIVAITASNVVLSAQSNNKKTTITFNPATEPQH